MDYTLRIIFSGLLALAPASDGGMWVFLVDARSSRIFADNVLQHAHQPVIRIAQREWAGVGREPDFWFAPGEGTKLEGLYFLDKEHFSLRGQLGRPALKVKKGTRVLGKTKPCFTRDDDHDPTTGCESHVFPYEEQKRDFSWVAGMPKITIGSVIVDSGKLNPACMATDGTVSGCPIVARFKLQTGTIQVFQLEGDEDGEDIFPEGVIELIVPIGPNESDVQLRAVAKKVELVVANIRGPLRLDSGGLMGFDIDNDIVLRPEDDDREVVVVVENLPMEDILRRTQHASSSTSAEDFKAFYELSAVKIPIEKRRIPLLLGANERICPITVFSQ